MLLLGVVGGSFCLCSRQVDGRLSLVGYGGAGAVRLLVLVEADLTGLQHHADAIPRS